MAPDLKAAVEERRALGLRHDPDFVAGLMGSARDKGSDELGMVLTADELADYQKQFDFERVVHESIVPLAEKSEKVAGMWFGHTRSRSITETADLRSWQVVSNVRRSE